MTRPQWLTIPLAGFLFASWALPFDDKEKERNRRTPATPPPTNAAPANRRAPQTNTAPRNTAPVNAPVRTNTYQNRTLQQPPQTNTVAQPRTRNVQPVQNNSAQPIRNNPVNTYPRPNRQGVNGPNLNRQPSNYPAATSRTQQFPNTQSLPRRDFRSPNGTVATFHGNTVRTMTTPSGMQISHVGAGREVIMRRGDRVMVTNAAGHGYVQRQVVVRNQVFVQRTYNYNGVQYAHVYRPYAYRGVVVNVYAPTRYYSPRFYAWAYNPWSVPVYYRWGWAGDPWYGAYGAAYFTPYPVYSSPSLWLTDYVVAASLRQAYQDGVDAGGANGFIGNNAAPASPMGDDVKQYIADEVQRQLAAQAAQTQQSQRQPEAPPASAEPPVVADHAIHTLVVFSSLNVDSGGQECALTEGDVLKFDGTQQWIGTSANVQLLWSKPQDCPAGNLVTVPVEQLQEMQNHMLENVNQGLQDLQTQQGQNGLPKLAKGLLGSTPAPFANELPPPDANVADTLQQQAQEADSAERQVVGEAKQTWAPPPAAASAEPPQTQVAAQPTAGPATTVLMKGMSIEQVIAGYGNPISIIDMGKKKIYIYKDVKITFNNGKVNKIE